MQSERIEALLAQLTDAQRQDYERLLAELSNHGGDLNQLSVDDQQRLAKLNAAMNPKDEILETDAVESLTVNVNESEEAHSTLGRAPEISPTTTPFGGLCGRAIKSAL